MARNVFSALESHKKDSERMRKHLDKGINLQAEKIKSYSIKIDDKQATIDEQNKKINQLVSSYF